MKEWHAELLAIVFQETVRVESFSRVRRVQGEFAHEIVTQRICRAGYGIPIGTQWCGTDTTGRQRRRRYLQALEQLGLLVLNPLHAGGRNKLVAITPFGRLVCGEPVSESDLLAYHTERMQETTGKRWLITPEMMTTMQLSMSAIFKPIVTPLLTPRKRRTS